MTSNDVCQLIKKKFKLNRVGHAGTLDPFATGLLLVLINKGTKLTYLFTELDKEYEGIIKLGIDTDTLDITGEVLEEKEVSVTDLELEKAFNDFPKTYLQLPPMYSAVRVDGVRLHRLARRGLDVKRSKRKVHIHELEKTSKLDNDLVTFRTLVSKGTYVRSLVLDLASSVNELATLKTLNRTKIGKFLVENAKTVDEVTLDDVIDIKDLFIDTKKLIFNDFLVKLCKNGVYLDDRHTNLNENFVVLDKDGNYIAYYEVIDKDKYKSIIIF